MGITGTNPNIYTKNNVYPSYNAVQINTSKPTANVPSSGGIYTYLQADGQIYYPPIQTADLSFKSDRIKTTPSGIDDYNNYTEVDKAGNVIADIKYSKEGNALVQTLKTKSPDGTTLEKTLKNSPDFKSMNVVIKDKDGKVLLNKDKSSKKIDDDKTQTVVNGETYDISGLKGDTINIEHNGQKVTLDLNKMLAPEVKMMEEKTDPDNYPLRDKTITDEEKTLLFNRIKSLQGDDLFRLAKSVEHIQYVDNTKMDAFFTDKGKTLLLSKKDWENSAMVTTHELGHAINHLNPENLLSDNKDFQTIRNKEKQNFRNNGDITGTDKFFNTKFIVGNNDLNWSETNDTDTDGNYLRDETFAESYNNLNNMDIIHYDNEVLPDRTLSMFKYMPETMAEVDKLSQI